jgi:uncharacterized membrane protein YfcA
MMVGISPTVAAASGANQIVGAAASGTFAHYRLGNVDIKLGLFILLGGLLGGSIGVQVIKFLKLTTGQVDFGIRLVYVVILSLIGGYMFIESLKTLRKKGKKKKKTFQLTRFTQRLPLQVHFEPSGITTSGLVPFGIGLITGILAGIMGIGGGFIMVPALIYLMGISTQVVVGTSLFQILFICINITIQQALVNRTVDIVLVMLLLAGSTIGAQLGAKATKYLKEDQIRILLAIIILGTMVKLLFDLVFLPKVDMTNYSITPCNWLSRLAQDHSFVYGLLAVSLAVTTGVGIGVIFRNRRRRIFKLR